MNACDPRLEMILNGWWDILPVEHPDLAKPLEPHLPASGWQEKAYLVPGFFTDHPYPAEWRASRSAWLRTTFQVKKEQLKQRAILTVKAAIPQAHIFVNGRLVGVQNDMFIGDPLDISSTIQVGENELVIFLTEFATYPHPETGLLGLLDVPWGCCISSAQDKQAGIWQDVILEWRPQVSVEDITIRTSYRQKQISFLVEVANFSQGDFGGKLEQYQHRRCS
jgi:beta-galactosidase/beta-glucuronidase